ncbi:MAG: hypothetical protein ACLR0N_16040 [Bilophila wadsworthia]
MSTNVAPSSRACFMMMAPSAKQAGMNTMSGLLMSLVVAEVLVAGVVLHVGNEFAADLLKGLFEEVGRRSRWRRRWTAAFL